MKETNSSSFDGLQALLTAEQAMPPLGLRKEHAPILDRKGLITPVGHPEPNAVKRYMRDELEELSHDRKWLSKVADALSATWKERNAKARARKSNTSNTGPVRGNGEEG